MASTGQMWEASGLTECSSLIRHKVEAETEQEAVILAQLWYNELGWLEQATFKKAKPI